MAVIYEWDVETVSAVENDLYELDEVIDHRHQVSFKDATTCAAESPADGEKHLIVLVRDDDAGRSWAYIENGALPTHFTDANGDECAKVPARFHAEVSKQKTA